MKVLIPAAGSGRRMGADRNKLLLPLQGKEVLAWTLAAAAAAPSVTWIGIIAHPRDYAAFGAIAAQISGVSVRLIEGGETRQASVYQGLLALREIVTFDDSSSLDSTVLNPTRSDPSRTDPKTLEGDDRVLVHDGARCLATPELFERCGAALNQVPSLIAAIAVKDTIKQAHPPTDADAPNRPYPYIANTPDRATLWAAQTPQGFRLGHLLKAHEQAQAAGWSVTDDASLLERLGDPVSLIPGEETNIKITTPLDLLIAAQILGDRLAADGSSARS